MSATLLCLSLIVTDGDTFRCNGVKVRIEAIDAPELSRCRKGRVCASGNGRAAKAYLERLTSKGRVQCAASGFDRYGRTLARCRVNGVDLGCAMIRAGHAIQRYGQARCGWRIWNL